MGLVRGDTRGRAPRSDIGWGVYIEIAAPKRNRKSLFVTE
jgi:hypothetical protein